MPTLERARSWYLAYDPLHSFSPHRFYAESESPRTLEALVRFDAARLLVLGVVRMARASPLSQFWERGWG